MSVHFAGDDRLHIRTLGVGKGASSMLTSNDRRPPHTSTCRVGFCVELEAIATRLEAIPTSNSKEDGVELGLHINFTPLRTKPMEHMNTLRVRSTPGDRRPVS